MADFLYEWEIIYGKLISGTHCAEAYVFVY